MVAKLNGFNTLERQYFWLVIVVAFWLGVADEKAGKIRRFLQWYNRPGWNRNVNDLFQKKINKGPL